MTDAFAPPRNTIYALASAMPARGGGAGLAVFRVSGPRADDALVFMTEPGAFARGFSARDPSLPADRRANLRALIDPATGEVVDRGIVLWFPAPNSFTGESVVEFHVHGGRAVIAAMLAALAALPFCRSAEPGEFTRRAFEHGKFDLTSAEAVADLVHADTAAQRRQALRQFDGALYRLYEDWRTILLRALAHLEAAIDFPDEDLPADVAAHALEPLDRLREEIAAHLVDRRGERLRDGVSIAIVGPPNAGKSSLLNVLARRDAAIVDAVAGTTRDVVEVHLDLGGYPVIVADTAGLRESTAAVEREGVRRARARAASADLRLVVVQAADRAGVPGEWQRVARDIATSAESWDPHTDLVVINKIDLLPDRTGLEAALGGSGADGHAPRVAWVGVSAKTGEGVAALVERLERQVAATIGEVPATIDGAMAGARAAAWQEPPPLTRARHREALERCLAALDRVADAARARPDDSELLAEDLRIAARALARITGRMDVEDMLDMVFRDFCIGK